MKLIKGRYTISQIKLNFSLHFQAKYGSNVLTIDTFKC